MATPDLQGTLEKLEEAFVTADLPAVRKLVGELKKKHPSAVETAVAEARLQAADGDPAAAQAKLEQATKAHPDDATALAYLGAIHVAQRHYHDGKPLLERALKLGCDLPALHHALGVVRAYDDDYADALIHLGKAGEAWPTSAPTFFYMGVSFAQLGDFERARNALLHTVQVSPQYVDAWEAVTRVLVELGEPEKALAALEEALKHNAGNLSLMRLRVMVLADHDRMAGAIEALRAIPEKDRNPDDWCNMALITADLGQLPEAMELARKAVEKFPKEARTHYTLAFLGERQEGADQRGIMASLQKAVDLGDPDGIAATRLGYLLLADGPDHNPGKARDVLEAARQRNDDAPGTLLNLALAYVKLEQKENAAPLCEAILRDERASPSDKEQAERLLNMEEG